MTCQKNAYCLMTAGILRNLYTFPRQTRQPNDLFTINTEYRPSRITLILGILLHFVQNIQTEVLTLPQSQTGKKPVQESLLSVPSLWQTQTPVNCTSTLFVWQDISCTIAMTCGTGFHQKHDHLSRNPPLWQQEKYH